MSNVDQIKSKIDIVSLVSSYIKLEKAGANFKGRCPFHNEKTPSFFVSPDRGSYYCFGCQAKGDIFTFVQEFEGLDFLGALKVLADKSGVVLDFSEKGEKTEKERFFGIMEQATFYYQKILSENKDAKNYLIKRGLQEETIKDFRLGFALSEWRNLFDFLKSKGVSEKDMISVGLIKRKEGTDKYYDTFRGRIMFPINDSSGRVVAFSGRILIADEKSPKYLNSPETSLFNKSEILFGLDKAKKDIRLKDYSVLVEGQMDLVMLHQAGISNTVASSGTALTSDHLIKLRRLSNRIIMSFDGDMAGFKASDRSAKLALSLGMELKVAKLPENKDPADLIKENPEEMKKCLKEAKHIIDFYTDSLIQTTSDSRELGQEIRKNVLPYVSILSSTIERDHFIKNISKKTFIKEEALWDDLSKVKIGEDISYKEDKNKQLQDHIKSIERKIIGIIMWQKESKNPLIDYLEIKQKLENILENPIEDIFKNYQKEKDILIFETESNYEKKDDLEKEISEMLKILEVGYLKKKYEEKMEFLKRAEQQRDSGNILKYLEECQKISQKINLLKNND